MRAFTDLRETRTRPTRGLHCFSALKRALTGTEYTERTQPVGWEFAALSADDPDMPWQWVWRRVADDSGTLLEQSRPFAALDACVDDAKRYGFEGDCGASPNVP